MDGILSPAVVETLEALLSVLGTALFTVGGLVAERAAVTNLLSGHAAIGAWELWMGSVALFVGLYLLGYKQLVRRFVALAE